MLVRFPRADVWRVASAERQHAERARLGVFDPAESEGLCSRERRGYRHRARTQAKRPGPVIAAGSLTSLLRRSGRTARRRSAAPGER
jgi:hypothetical protein